MIHTTVITRAFCLCIWHVNDEFMADLPRLLQAHLQRYRIGQKAPIGLLLAAIVSLKFCFGALLLSGLLFESLTSDDLWRVFAGYLFRPTVAKSVNSP